METAIATSYWITCPKCEHETEFVFGQSKGRVCERCEYYFGYRSSTSVIYGMEVFDAFGITFSIDWDNQVIVHHELPLPEKVHHFIWLNQGYIVWHLTKDLSEAEQLLSGGPFGGQKHHVHVQMYTRRVIKNVERAKWAVYLPKEKNDPRLYFAGYATSEQKAKHFIAEWQKP